MINPTRSYSPEEFALDLYGSVADGGSLADAVAPLAQQIGATTHAVHMMHCVSGALRESRCEGGGLTPGVAADYVDHWVFRDPWAKAALQHGSGVLNMSRVVSLQDYRRSAIWNEWKAPRDGALHCISATMSAPDGLAGRIAFHRGPRGEPFEAAEESLIQSVFPHLRRALVIQARLAADGWHAARAARASFSALRQGVVLLDRHRRIVLTNPAVEAMAARNDGLTLTTEGGLSSHDPQVRQALARAVGSAVAAISGNLRMMPDAGGVALPRRDAKAPYLVQALPLKRVDGADVPGGFTGVMLIINDETARARPHAPLLRQAFGLTAAEGSLAAALAAGRSLEKHASLRRIAISTVRAQLTAVRRKTGSRNLAELTGLLGRMIT